MNVGPMEIVIVLVLALLVFGPKRLPQAGRSLGQAMREFRKVTSTAREELGLDEVAKGVDDIKSTLSIDLNAGGSAESPNRGAGATVAAAGVAATTDQSPATADQPAGGFVGYQSHQAEDRAQAGPAADLAEPEASGTEPQEEVHPAATSTPRSAVNAPVGTTAVTAPSESPGTDA
jgi:sec-independent protein translocase protein TatA